MYIFTRFQHSSLDFFDFIFLRSKFHKSENGPSTHKLYATWCDSWYRTIIAYNPDTVLDFIAWFLNLFFDKLVEIVTHYS